MKKIMLTVLSVALISSSVSNVQAKVWSPPYSETTVGLCAAGVSVAVWSALKGLYDTPFCSFNYKKTLPISAAAIASGALSWWIFSKYTASGHLDCAITLIDGEGSAEVELFELLNDTMIDNPQELAKLVVSHFGACRNELARSVSALELLYKELSTALGYIRLARPSLSEFEISQADHYKKIAFEIVDKIKAVSLLIKGHEDYQRQYENEMEREKIVAQHEKAGAIREAGYVQALCN